MHHAPCTEVQKQYKIPPYLSNTFVPLSISIRHRTRTASLSMMNIVSDEEEQLPSNTGGILAHLQELLNEVRELKHKTELTNDELQREKLSNAANNDSLQKDIRNLQDQLNALEEAKAELTDDVSELKQELRNQQEENSTVAPALSRGLSARHRPSLRALPSFLFQRHVTSNDGLPMDTFALMMTSHPRSQAWLLGIFAFAFQMVLVCMIGTDQLQESIMSSHFNVPFKVDSTVRAGQFFAIIFALATQTDITTSIRLIVMFWNDPNWGKTILQRDESAPPPTKAEWQVHIALPNILKLVQGILVTIITIVVIVQSEDIIDLFKDFAALMVLSETDNIFFGLAKSGYLGSDLHRRAIEAQEIDLKYEVNESPEDLSGSPQHAPSTSTHDKDFLIRSIILFAIAMVMIGGWLYIVICQVTGIYFFRRYPGCDVDNAFELASKHFGDGVCFGGPLNTLECEFEGEDCVNFNLAFPLCRGDNRTNVQTSLGNGKCEKEFMNSDCAYDGGDCCPNTIVNDPAFGDGHCDERMNTENCGYDDGDCVEYNRDFSGCPYDVVFRNPTFGDGQCNGGIASTKYCAYDNSDCDRFIDMYPDCPINDLAKIDGANDAVMGDGVCNSGIYRIEECGYEFGDCKHFQVGQTVSITADGAESSDRLDFSMVLSLNGTVMALGMEYIGEDGTNVDSDGRGLARILGYDDNRMMWIQLGSDIVGSQTVRSDDNFGQRLSLSSNGNRIVISSASEVQIYYFNSTSGENWKQVGQTIISSVTYPNAVMSADGSKVALIHSEDEIRIYNFHSDPSINDHTVTIIPGGSLSSDTRLEFNSLDSSRLLVLNDNVVAKVYQHVADPPLKLFFPDTTRKSWIQIGKDIGGRVGGRYPAAASSAMSADGNRIAVSFHTTSTDAPGQVNVFDYHTMTDEWVPVGESIKSSLAINSDDGFGYSIHLSSDGNLLVIGSTSRKCQDGTNRFAIKECTTGYSYAEFYFDHPDLNRFHQVIPKSSSSYKANGNILNLADFEQSESRISGLHFSLSGDGMALSISGYDVDDQKALIEVYNIDEFFHTGVLRSKGWRLWVNPRNSLSPNSWDVAEIEFYASPDCTGEKIPNTGAVVDSGNIGGNYVPSNAFGNDSAIWGGRRDISGFFHIGMTYSSEVTVGCVKVWNDRNWATTELTIQATNENDDWEDIHVAKDLDTASYAMNTIAIYL